MFDDKQLKQAVLDQLKWEPSVNAAHIGVSAKDGVVTLMGHVPSFSEKSAAEAAVRRIKDVKGIAEEIKVELPFAAKHGDEEIAAAAVARLKWDSSIPSDAVKVKVEQGWVTLTGDVDWRYQHDAAVDDVRNLWGVVGVSNQIMVKPTPDVAGIRDSITAALHRSWFDPDNITVTADGGRVKLTGTVDSWYGREVAGTTAWAARGTVSVENDLKVV